ncbi:MAG TPA: hypothetical protein VHG93_01810 [Longimicrobium sp.]|nr:hypothetical protein [Longimicrobium sp.]
MPIPMTPGGDGAAPAASAAAEAVQPAPQQAQAAPRPLATVLPAWDLVPPSHVLAFRRRA